ncbi:pentatricopeptide repeat-containing protein At1g32415, mitochondrial [Spinacia oleracea]|uniref:Pentatricopeptide repeat-containing protein At1g32415, mitochondrial n=1 Tax=Spinacia oleracea TaxID=3562 RepID=A0A9R0JYM4_SPIOL|nr:pentatricopeptide repeat-containing protein At1g32415, mitochondrial [Spinacia oleracea]
MRLYCARNLAFSLSRTPTKLINRTFSTTLSDSQLVFSTFQRSNESQLLDCLAYGNLQYARQLLDEMRHRENQSPVITWTSVLTRFSKRGRVDEARTLFDIMPERNVVTCNAMLSGYVQSGKLSEACKFFEAMPVKNVVSWTCLLCGLMKYGMVEEGKALFEAMPEKNVVTWNSMVVGLVKNGDLEGGRLIFEIMPVRDSVSWNAMIGGYAENGTMEEAMELFDQMGGKDVNVITWTTLISGYCKAGEVWTAYGLFRRMPGKNVVSWTAMVGGFSWNSYYEEAILLALEMRRAGVKMNEETCISLAYACAGMGFPRLGMQLHAFIITNNFECLDQSGRLLNSLVYMYSRYGLMEYAYSIFEKNKNNWKTQSCNALINGYIQIEKLDKAEYVFNNMPFYDKISVTSMISGYFDVGEVAKAYELFNNMTDKDNIVWTVMISGYVQNELFLEAMCLFSEMWMQGVIPLQSTYSVLLGAAGAASHLEQGRQLHCLLIKTQLNLDLILENSLISMYGKCGQIGDSYQIFSNMDCKDLVSWNSMIMGFSSHGLADEALSLFNGMPKLLIKPNCVTFLGILSACSHAGLVKEGWLIYRAMNENYGVVPDLEHHICMINLLGRAGKVGEAEQFVLSLPPEQGVSVWGALLGVCRLGEGNTDIAGRIFERLLELDPLNAAAHVVHCNMLAAAGQYGEERMLRKEMRSKGVRKAPGLSWISSGKRTHVFLSGDKSTISR